MKRHALALAKLAISAATLYLVSRSVDWSSVLARFADGSPVWILVFLAGFWAAQAVFALRCVYVAEAIGGRLSFATAARAHLLGLWFNQVLPTGLGGDVVKAMIIGEPLGAGLAVRAVLLDRVSGLLFLMLALLVGAPFYADLFRAQPGLAPAIAAMATGFLVLSGLAAWQGERFFESLRRMPWREPLARLGADFRRLCIGRAAWRQLWTSAVVHFHGIFCFAVIALAIDETIAPKILVLVVPLVFLAALFPVSFAGWGFREAGAVWLFGLAGVPAEVALAMSVGFGVLLIVAAAPGLAFLFLNARAELPPRKPAR